jgi:hypothetical protein
MGYVVRLTQENGYTTPSWVFELARLKINLISGGRPALYRVYSDLATFQQTTGLTSSECEHLSYRLIEFENAVVVSAHQLPVDCVRFGSPKVCPGCLKEDEYCRIIWDLSPFTACPSHKTILIDRCPRCNKRLSWVRNRVSVCRCGFDWRGAEAGEADPSGLRLSRQILRLFYRAADDASDVSEYDSPVYGLEAGDLFRALEIVAGWHVFTLTGRHLRTRVDNALCHQAYTRALSAFEDWPNNFHTFLRQVERISGKDVHDSRWYSQADEALRKRALYFMAVALEDYVKKYNLSADYNGRTPPKLFRRFLTKPEACRFLRIEPKWLDLLIEQGKLDITRRWGGSEVLVCRESIMCFMKSLNCLLHINRVAGELNIEVEDVEDLIRHGCLKAESGPDVDGLTNWGFTREELNSFVDAISERIVVNDNDRPKDLVVAKEVLGRLRRLNIGAGRLAADVLSLKIVPAADMDRPGFAGLLFRKNDVTDYIESLGKEVHRQECQPKYVPKYKLWTKALIAVKEVNLRISSSSTAKQTDNLEMIELSLDDLAHTAFRVLYRAAPGGCQM